MTSKWMRSAPAASTASTSAPRRAKSADRLEILYKAKRKGFTIKEAPIKFHSRKAGKSNVGYNIRGLKEALRIVSLVIRLRTR